MAMKLRDETSKANDAVIQIRTLKEKLDETTRQSGQSES